MKNNNINKRNENHLGYTNQISSRSTKSSLQFELLILRFTYFTYVIAYEIDKQFSDGWGTLFQCEISHFYKLKAMENLMIWKLLEGFYLQMMLYYSAER